MKIQELKEKVFPLLRAGKRNDALQLIRSVESEALSTLQWIGKDTDERAEVFANACQVFIHLEDGEPEKAVSFIDQAGDDEVSLGLLTISQIVVKEVGLPEGGGVPSTIDLCISLAEAGSKYALSKDSKKHAAMLNHNVAAFISPDFDDNIPQPLLEKGERAAVNSLEIRKEMGAPVGVSWGEWMVGIYSLAKGDGKAAIEHFSESSRVGDEIEEEKGRKTYVAWANLYHGKTLAKLFPEKRDKGMKLMRKAHSLFKEIEDDWSIGHAESLLERFSK